MTNRFYPPIPHLFHEGGGGGRKLALNLWLQNKKDMKTDFFGYESVEQWSMMCYGVEAITEQVCNSKTKFIWWWPLSISFWSIKAVPSKSSQDQPTSPSSSSSPSPPGNSVLRFVRPQCYAVAQGWREQGSGPRDKQMPEHYGPPTFLTVAPVTRRVTKISGPISYPPPSLTLPLPCPIFLFF